MKEFKQILASKCAFTMAEILISLTIIGIIAVLTLPALQANINERVWNAQRKALYSRMSQALSMMPALNGYGTYSATVTNNGGDLTIDVTEDTAAMTFVTEGLSKVFKINNVCDEQHLADCGIPSQYNYTTTITIGNTTYTNPFTKNMPTSLVEFNTVFETASPSFKAINTKAAAFETANGESILTLYNPYCEAAPELYDSRESVTDPFIPSAQNMCANFIYDLNGTKGPNTIGKDIGVITALYPTNTNVVAPMLTTPFTYKSGSQYDKFCDEDSRLPNLDELCALCFNKNIFPMGTGTYWSSAVSVSDSTLAWAVGMGGLCDRIQLNRGGYYNVKCVKK